MLTSDKLIFVELQKTGSTGLKKFLGNIVGGESTGKTSAYAGELLALGKPIVGLVCHPLVWYLDQWRLGCAGRGELYKHLVDEKRWNLLRVHATKTAKPAKAEGGDKARQKDAPAEWNADFAKQRWYADENNVEAFREWLSAVATHPALRNLIDRGYKVSRIGRLAGLMTYQYVMRFLRDGENIERSIDTVDALRSFMHERAITTHFVRAEYAGEDLIRVLDELGIETTPEQREQAAQFKRRGADAKLVRQFYDDASMRLVAEREQLMGELFGYEMMAPGSAAAKPGKKKDKQKDKPEKAGKAKAEAKGKDDGPKLSKEERAQKREARTERRAAKEAKVADVATPAADPSTAATTSPAKSEAPAPAQDKPTKAPKPDKPPKAKRVKNRPVDDDVVEAEA
jgi:hypothetical protein